jgi:predicted GNAT superfamily acetyltransferase
VRRLFDAVWRPGPEGSVMSTDILRALTKSGNYLAGAYDGTELVGACAALFGAPAQRSMHSHVTGVSPATGRRGVGFALKLHQRAWALARDIATITWTFDPLVSRNAYVNLAKLGAVADEYLANFYGELRDGVNVRGGDSDRLLVRWPLAAPQVAAACAGTPHRLDAQAELARGAAVALDRSEDGSPVAGTSDARTVLVAVPPDIEALRSTDPGAAGQWRLAVRQALASLLAGGATVAGFDRSGWYVVRR